MEELSAEDVDALLRESQAVREEASRLLCNFHLVEHLRRYGEVEVAGGYRWETTPTFLRGGHTKRWVLTGPCR